MQDIQNNNNIMKINISSLKPFLKHPYKPYTDDKINELAESIKAQGLIVPILIRPIEDENYTHEIVAGHVRLVFN